MPTGLPNNIVGDSNLIHYLNKHREASRSLQPSSAPGALVSHTIHGVLHETSIALPQVLVDSVTGIHFESKIEVDNTTSYPAQSLVHFGSAISLTTTGIRLPSAPTGALVVVRPGWWITTQAVAAKTTDGSSGNEVWQAPVWPMPGVDNDSASRYWTYLGDVFC